MCKGSFPRLWTCGCVRELQQALDLMSPLPQKIYATTNLYVAGPPTEQA